ncbi:MAG: DUF5615 family PIN-like protein [Bryobacteraceae bacterium]
MNLLLLDQGLPRDAAALLRDAGIACQHVEDLGMAAAKDPVIMDWAREYGAAVVTLDSDFHALLVLHRKPFPSVIRIRLQGLNGPAAAELLRPVVKAYSAELAAGCMITIKARKVTCHLLPR